jgi:hypothetical protein
MEVAHPVGAVVGRRVTLGMTAGAQDEPAVGRMPSGPNPSKANTRSGKRSWTSSMRSSLVSRSGSGDSFQVLVRWKVIPRRASGQRKASRLIRIMWPGTRRRWAASLRTDQRVKGWPSLVGRVMAVWTTKSSSSGLSRRGRPPAHRGSRQARPISLNRWITSRTVFSSARTSWAITGTRPADRGQQHHRAPVPHRTGASPAHDPLQLLPLLVGQSAHKDRLSHHTPSDRIGRHCTSNRPDHGPGEPMRSEH